MLLRPPFCVFARRVREICASRRVLPLAFPQMRLDNTIQVLPAPPFRKIKRNYVAERHISPAPDGQIFRSLCLGASFRSLFRKCVLLCLQVLPAPPFRKIKRNYVADRVSRTRRANLSFSLLRRVLPLAFPQMRLALPKGITCAAFSQNQTKSHRR